PFCLPPRPALPPHNGGRGWGPGWFLPARLDLGRVRNRHLLATFELPSLSATEQANGIHQTLTNLPRGVGGAPHRLLGGCNLWAAMGAARRSEGRLAWFCRPRHLVHDAFDPTRRIPRHAGHPGQAGRAPACPEPRPRRTYAYRREGAGGYRAPSRRRPARRLGPRGDVPAQK